MKKFLLPLVFATCLLLPLVSTSQTYSAFGMAVNNNNNLFDTVNVSNGDDTLLFRFVNAPNYAWNSVKIVVYYQGNFGPGPNPISMYLRGENNINVGGVDPAQVNCGPEDSTVISTATVNLNTWNSNDTIDFTLTASGSMGPCVSSVRVKLEYEYCSAPGGPVQFASAGFVGNYACALGGNIYSLTGTPADGTFSVPGVTGC